MTMPHLPTDSSSETLKCLLQGVRNPWWKGLNSALLVASAMVAAPAEAAPFTLSGSGIWSSTSTWIDRAVPGNSGTDLVQGQATVGGIEVNLDTATVLIGTLQVSAPASGTGTVTLTGNEDYSGVLSIGAVKVASGATVVFAEPLTVYTPNLKLNADGGLGRIEFKGTLSDPLDGELTPISTGSVTVAGGVVVFKGTSTYAGATELQAGKLVVGGVDGLGFSSALNLTGGTLTADPYLNATDSTGRDMATAVSVLGNVQIGEAGADALTLSGGVDLGGAARTLTVSSTVDISSSITDGGLTSGKLVKAGDGKLILSSPNSYTGGTELQAGILLVTAGDALGAAADGGPGGKLSVTGGTLQLGAEQNISALEIKGGAIVADPTADAANIGRIVVKGGSISADVAGTAEVSVVLADDPDGVRAALVKTGAGTLILSGENEYGGGTTLSAGTLIAGNDKALGTGGVLLAGGVLSTDGVARVLANDVVLSGTVQFGGSGALTFSGTFSLNSASAALNTATDTVLSGEVMDGASAPAGGGRLIKEGAAKLTLTAVNSYAGGTELRSGELVATADGALGSGAVTVNSGTLHVGSTTQTISGLALKGGAIAGNIGGKFVIQSGTGSFVQADVATSASISAAIDGNAGVRKTGAGDLYLTGENTYRGDTLIEAGKVIVNSGDSDSTSPLGAPGVGAIVLSGGKLVVTGTGAGSSVSLDKEVRVVTSGQLIAEGASLNISKLSVASAGAAQVSGDITATAVDVSGSLTLSGNSPLRAQTLSARSGSTFVWDKPTLSGAQGIVITGNAATDLSAASLQFSSAFVTKALAETGSLNSAGLFSGTLVVGNFVTSNGTVSAPSSVTQPEGIVRFKLVSRDEQKAIDLVLERRSFQQFLPSGSGFGQVLDGLTGDGLKELLKAIPAGADAKTVAEILRKADGGRTFASVAAATPAQALAASASVDSHLDDLSAPGGGSSMSMGVRVGAPSKSTVSMSTPSGGESDRNWMVWTSGYGSWGRTSADAAGNGRSRSSGGGGSIGLERQMGDLMAGVLVSLGESVTRADDPYLRVKSDSWNVGGYGSMNIGAITLDASALWGTSEQESQRAVPTGSIATARYSTQNWQTGVGIAANLAPKDSSWQVSPVARLKYLNSSEDAFSETGTALNVGSSAHNDSHVISKLGLRIAKNTQLTSSTVLGLDGAAYWVHDYNSEGRDLQYSLGGSAYTSRTRDRQPDSAQLNLGMQTTFSDMLTLRLSGQQDLSEDRKQTTGLFSVAYKF